MVSYEDPIKFESVSLQPDDGHSTDSLSLEQLATNSPSTIDQQHVPQELENYNPNGFFEKWVLEKARLVNNCSEADINVIRSRAQSVGQLLAPFDFIITSGKSREIAMKLLQMGGMPSEKVKQFDHHSNSIVYKDEESPYNSLSTQDRITITTEMLRKLGVPLDQGRKISIAIFDELIRSGGKAALYTKVFRQLPGIDRFAFASLGSQFGKEGIKQQFQELGEDPTAVILPDANSTDAWPSLLVVKGLADLMSITSDEGQEDKGISYPLEQISKNVVQRVIEMMK